LPDLEQKLDGVYTNKLPDTYPISAYSYVIAQESTENPQKGAVLGKYIEYDACEGQQAAGKLGYSPLPPNLVEDDFQAIDRISGAAKAPAYPTTANCENPYIDGQICLPDEPVASGGCQSTTTTTPPGGTTIPGQSSIPGGTTIPGQSTIPGQTTISSQTTIPGQTTSPGGTKPGKTTLPDDKTAPVQTTLPAGVLGPGTGSPGNNTLPPGYNLLQAVNGLQGHDGPDGTTLDAALAASAVVLVAPAVLLGARRRRKRVHAISQGPK
jgi:hypothetical protein